MSISCFVLRALLGVPPLFSNALLRKALRGLHHPELRFFDEMKHMFLLMSKKQPTLARKIYVKMREECLAIDGRKTGDKVQCGSAMRRCHLRTPLFVTVGQ